MTNSFDDKSQAPEAKTEEEKDFVYYPITGKRFILPDQEEEFRQYNLFDEISDEQLKGMSAATEDHADAIRVVAQETTELHKGSEEMPPELEEFKQLVLSRLINYYESSARAMDSPISETSVESVFKGILEPAADLAELITNPKYEELKRYEINSWLISRITENITTIETAKSQLESWLQKTPYIQKAMDTITGEEKYNHYTFADLADTTIDDDGTCLWDHLVERAAEFFDSNPIENTDTKKELQIISTELPTLIGLSPSYHSMPNNALMNTLQRKPSINAGEFDMLVSNGRGRRQEITSYTMVSYDSGDSNINVSISQLSEYDRQVSDAIISLWIEAGNQGIEPILTPDMIYRAMPGGGDKASPQQKGAITKAIEKFRRLHIYVDASEEARKMNFTGPDNNPITSLIFDEFYLSATGIQIQSGGKSINAFQITSKPIILKYCEMTKQILTVKSKHIEIKQVKNGSISTIPIKMNADRQAMTGYMLRRIAVMKHDKRNKVRTQSNVILFDTLFMETGQMTTNREQQRRNRKFCFEVLDYWKADGYISDYQMQTKGRAITGVIIYL